MLYATLNDSLQTKHFTHNTTALIPLAIHIFPKVSEKKTLIL